MVLGLVKLDARSYGIPVFASKNCGDVVNDNINGFLVENKSSQIIEKLDFLNKNRELLHSFSESAVDRIKDFSLDNFEDILKIELAKKEIYL